MLDHVTACFEAVATVKPKLDVVPLLPSLTWTPGERQALNTVIGQLGVTVPSLRHFPCPPAPNTQPLPGILCTERAALLPGLQEVSAASAEDVAAGDALVDAMNAEREVHGLSPLALNLVSSHLHGQRGLATRSHAGAARVEGGWSGPLQFDTVAAGGTFDRMHAGHRLLLAATALVARKHIFVGITGACVFRRRGGGGQRHG
jgi:hypothetical protein